MLVQHVNTYNPQRLIANFNFHMITMNNNVV